MMLRMKNKTYKQNSREIPCHRLYNEKESGCRNGLSILCGNPNFQLVVVVAVVAATI